MSDHENELEKLVQMFREQPLDTALVDAVLDDQAKWYYVPTEASSVSGNAAELLLDVHRRLDEAQVSLLLDSCRDNVLDSLIKPFGLSRAMFDDKLGGNVTTIHNFVKGVTATKQDGDRYEGYADDYKHEEYDKGFPKRRKQALKAEGPLIDGYTGHELPKDGRAQLDHVVSAHEIDQNPNAHLFLSPEHRVAMASSDENLVMTDHRINGSKQDRPMADWLDRPSRNGQTPDERFGVDREKAMAADKASRQAMNRKLLRARVKKQGTELAKTAAWEGARMGLQQALGLLLREFVVALFDEARDIFRHGFKNGRVDAGFWTVLKERLDRISARVVSKWKDALVAFRDGALSAFFSNLVTFLINSVMTTVARLGRMIREGFFSLCRALKIALFPPEGLTRQEAAHEAVKIMGAALVIMGGILLEELVDTLLKSIPFLGQIASLITPVLMGLVIGLTSSIVVYLIDKLDPFGVVAAAKHAHVIDQLDQMMSGMVEEADASYAVFALPVVDV